MIMAKSIEEQIEDWGKNNSERQNTILKPKALTQRLKLPFKLLLQNLAVQVQIIQI